jgi:hypothetical protein
VAEALTFSAWLHRGLGRATLGCSRWPASVVQPLHAAGQSAPTMPRCVAAPFPVAARDPRCGHRPSHTTACIKPARKRRAIALARGLAVTALSLAIGLPPRSAQRLALQLRPSQRRKHVSACQNSAASTMDVSVANHERSRQDLSVKQAVGCKRLLGRSRRCGKLDAHSSTRPFRTPAFVFPNLSAGSSVPVPPAAAYPTVAAGKSARQ